MWQEVCNTITLVSTTSKTHHRDGNSWETILVNYCIIFPKLSVCKIICIELLLLYRIDFYTLQHVKTYILYADSFIYVIYNCLRIVVSYTCCIVYLLCLSSSCGPFVASLFVCPFMIVPSAFSNVYIMFFFYQFLLYIYIYIYVWKLNQTVLELDFRAVKCLFFPRRELNPHHWYTAAPFA